MSDFEIETSLDDKSGEWYSPCPICSDVYVGFTSRGSVDAVVNHMNEEHKEDGRVGHA